MSIKLVPTSSFFVLDDEANGACSERPERDAFYCIKALDFDDARLASLEERDKTNLRGNGTLTYGEITFEAIYAIINRLRQDRSWAAEPQGRSKTFVDLGSGAGRVLFSAAVCYPFQKCVGIEILESLHKLALAARNEYDRISDLWGGDFTDSVELVRGSMFDLNLFDWTQADVVVACSTCFSADMFEGLSVMGSRMKKGSYFISLSESLPKHNERNFDLVHTETLPSSWGTVEVFFHRHL